MNEKDCEQNLEEVYVETPIGDLLIRVCVNGLHCLSKQSPNSYSQPNLNTEVKIKDQEFSSKNKLIDESVKWLADYFKSGQRNEVPVPPFCPSMTKSEFNRNVWTTLMKGTKFGQTISYSSLAAISVGKPTASRAVGTAMKNNPFILMVPCHRVLKKDGSLGNYSAGNSLKEWLNSFEKEFKPI